jgi:hypothetical protein
VLATARQILAPLNKYLVMLNIPVLDAIKQVPCYAKFLKELCTHKKEQKLKGCKKVSVGENVSAVIQRKLPAKCKDPGMFTIPCTIGNTRFEKAMADLGASINVIPYSIYASLKLGPLHKTGVGPARDTLHQPACNQLDLQECLKFHHPSSSDDEDDADRTIPLPEDV